mmetsp:Transcript_34380/g.73215  ORF Transcript_34380/g.73215 Transcript_34380/m.73215 type:complete len:264 (+) Transcript_34380:88-879(+)
MRDMTTASALRTTPSSLKEFPSPSLPITAFCCLRFRVLSLEIVLEDSSLTFVNSSNSDASPSSLPPPRPRSPPRSFLSPRRPLRLRPPLRPLRLRLRRRLRRRPLRLRPRRLFDRLRRRSLSLPLSLSLSLSLSFLSSPLSFSESFVAFFASGSSFASDLLLSLSASLSFPSVFAFLSLSSSFGFSAASFESVAAGFLTRTGVGDRERFSAPTAKAAAIGEARAGSLSTIASAVVVPALTAASGKRGGVSFLASGRGSLPTTG